MKKLFAAFIYLLVFPDLSYAQANKPAVKNADNRSLLWKITRSDMKQPSFLFGTIHLLCSKDYIWTPAMSKSLKACAEVCFEMDMDDQSVLVKVAQGMIDQSGKSLKDYFTEEDYTTVARFVKDSLGLNIAMFQQMKPAALQTAFAAQAVNCSNPVSYESNIKEEAMKLDMEITGLEVPEEQLAIFDAMPVDSVIKDIVSMARDYSSERSDYNKMLKAYKKQDIQALYAIIESSKISSDDLNTFLYERNAKWIERMEERMDQHPVFFAVGAGHLPGENGIIQLLRNSGYRLEPVK